MKGGVAAMLGAARVIAESGGLARGALIVAAVVDEEHSSLGADALVATWRADAAVVTEPTDLDVAVAHKGFQWVEVETRGRAAHGSRPRGRARRDPAHGPRAGRLEALDRQLQTRPAHPLLGTASLHASLIHGGRELSSYPDRAWLEFERRTLPGEPATSRCGEASAHSRRLRARATRSSTPTRRQLFGRDAYEIDPASIRCPAMLDAAPRRRSGAPRRASA